MNLTAHRDQVLRNATSIILREAYALSQIVVPKSLKASVKAQMLADDYARLLLSPFWSEYVHDGRYSIYQPRPKPPLIFFKDPTRDPRLNNGRTPDRYEDLRHLLPHEFYYARLNKLIIQTRFVKGTRPRPFFERDMKPLIPEFEYEVEEMVREAVQDFVYDNLPKLKPLTLRIK